LIDPSDPEDAATLDKLARLCIERAQRTGHRRGTDHPAAKLDTARVKAIRAVWAAADALRRGAGKPPLSLDKPLGKDERGLLRALGKLYGVNASTVRDVLRRRTWAHVA
jgi:hypothetical protein